jgi:hypothetical protein
MVSFGDGLPIRGRTFRSTTWGSIQLHSCVCTTSSTGVGERELLTCSAASRQADCFRFCAIPGLM